MQRVMRISAILLLLVAGCGLLLRKQAESTTPSRTEARKARSPEEMQPAITPTAPSQKMDIVVHLDGRHVLTLHGAIGREDNQPVSYIFTADGSSPPAVTPGAATSQPPATAPSATQPAAVHQAVYLLKPTEGNARPIRCKCEIVQREEGSRASIILVADGQLPDIKLLGDTPTRMLPVRILDAPNADPDRSGGVVLAAMGPVGEGFINALFDPQDDYALKIDGRVTCEVASNGVALLTSLPEPRGNTQTALTLTSRRRFLQSTCNLDEYTPLDRLARPSSPAGFSACDVRPAMGDDAVLRMAKWMAANLKPFGAEYVAFHESGRANAEHSGDRGQPQSNDSLSETIEQLGMKAAACRDGGMAGLPAVRELARQGIILSLPGHDRTEPDYEQFKRMVNVYNDMLFGYRVHGLTGYCDPGPITVGDPLPLERARMWASLMGLSGLVLMTGEDTDQLPAERVELLRRICPPAPIRAMDLFSHQKMVSPDLWDLKIAADYDRWDVLGVFNWSPRAATRTIQLSKLGITAGQAPRFAVYDFWRQQLLAVTRDSFDVYLQATSCRVLSIRRLCEREPTLISTSRHVTQGAVDLRDLRFDPQNLTMTGKSDLVAGDPYELRILVPEGADSFEVAGVETEGTSTLVRADGPLRVVTLEGDATRATTWRITFARASQKSEPPAAPAHLAALQNTRGVLLTWDGRDERAVLFRVYRDNELIATVDGRQYDYQDSGVLYGRKYAYTVAAVDFAGRESARAKPITHQTPAPAATYLTKLVPLSVEQTELPLGINRSISGRLMRIADQRYAHGLGTVAGMRVRYFLGGGYASFRGEVGIDDETGRTGSVVCEVYGDEELLFKSNVLRGGQRPEPFNVAVKGKRILTLVVTDAGDGTQGDHADWGDAYLQVVLPAP